TKSSGENTETGSRLHPQEQTKHAAEPTARRHLQQLRPRRLRHRRCDIPEDPHAKEHRRRRAALPAERPRAERTDGGRLSVSESGESGYEVRAGGGEVVYSFQRITQNAARTAAFWSMCVLRRRWRSRALTRNA